MTKALFDPFTFDDFITNFFEKKYLHLERKINYNDFVLTEKEINDFLSRNDIYYPSIRLVKDGIEINRKEYTDSASIGNFNVEGYVNNDKLFTYLNDGTTIVIESSQRYFENINKLCLELNSMFHFILNTNIYITPPNSKGFTAHWDTHDVVVLQISGYKNWRLYGSEIELPSNKQSSNKFAPIFKDFNKEAEESLRLTAGDLFYLPRGIIHSADTDDVLSIHISIGFNSLNWDDFFKEILKDLDNNLIFRRSFPFWDMSKFDEYYLECVNVINEMFNDSNKKKAIAALFNKTNSHRLQNSRGRFNNTLHNSNINAHSTIKLNEGIQILITKSESIVNISFYNKSITFPIIIEDVLKYVITQNKILISEIPLLDNDSKIIFARKLINEGLFYLIL